MYVCMFIVAWTLERIKAARSAAEDSSMYIYVVSLDEHIHHVTHGPSWIGATAWAPLLVPRPWPSAGKMAIALRNVYSIMKFNITDCN